VPDHASGLTSAPACPRFRSHVPRARIARVVTAPEIRTIGVVGLGAMGAGIAQLAVEAGFDTIGREVTDELGEKARERIGHFLQRKVEKARMSGEDRESALGRLSLVTDLSALADCDLVVEAIVEELDAKKALFAELEGIVRPLAILATNTSALSVTEIGAATSRPERVVGMHFFNPAPVLPLVEVIRTDLTDGAVFDTAYVFAERLGKQPIACNDTPGFVVNRILIPLLNDCVRVIDEARVSPEDVDRAMRFGTNWPIGPCALIDLIGIDVHVHASEALYEALREPRMAPPPRLVRMAQAGHLGRKSGRGFFSYGD
jgi:3-hydroxybutyryl-CoA dehydrogenase